MSRISTVWRKEFADTLRDRRTLIAMLVVPIVLYPVLMLGSLQAFELQVGRLKQEEYVVAVESAAVRDWLRQRVLDADADDAPAENLPTAPALANPDEHTQREPLRRGAGAAQRDVRQRPPPYRIEVVDSVVRAVFAGQAHVGLIVHAAELAAPPGSGTTRLTLVLDQTEIRSQIAAAGLQGVFDRLAERVVAQRLQLHGLPRDFTRPFVLEQKQIAPPEKVGGSVLGQIVPLILVIMTITGAIYPAIDLTAGERERGTLETLMAAPVPKVDLIAGKFVVVASIGMLSAALNLLSIGGTVYLGGLGDVLTRGGAAAIPLKVLPLVLVVLMPLAVMFSAVLLAVCSFARSFKEAQNYVMPVMVAVLAPAVIGVLPGTELAGPLLILPVTNIVILTRDLFMGRIDHLAILWVTLSTVVYASAAVAVAARLFGQEAVLFADSASLRTLLRRRFFKPSAAPSAASAFLLLALVYSLNFFAQQAMLKSGLTLASPPYLATFTLTLVGLFVLLPMGIARYRRVRLAGAFALQPPPPAGWLAGLCLGASTWVLALAWLALQQRFLPLPPDFREAAAPLEQQLRALPLLTVAFYFALVPAFCEELFFRGYALSGLRTALGRAGAVVVVALAFGLTHYSVHRLPMTALLGLALGLLVVQFRSIWPAVLAHALHNALILLITREDGLLPLLRRLGFLGEAGDDIYPPTPYLAAALAAFLFGLVLCLRAPARPGPPPDAAGGGSP